VVNKGKPPTKAFNGIPKVNLIKNFRKEKGVNKYLGHNRLGETPNIFNPLMGIWRERFFGALKLGKFRSVFPYTLGPREKSILRERIVENKEKG